MKNTILAILFLTTISPLAIALSPTQDRTIVIPPQGTAGSGGGGSFDDLQFKGVGYSVLDGLVSIDSISGLNLSNLRSILAEARVIPLATRLIVQINGKEFPRDAAYDEVEDVIYLSPTFGNPDASYIAGLIEQEKTNADFLQRVIVIHEGIRRAHKLKLSPTNDDDYTLSLNITRLAYQVTNGNLKSTISPVTEELWLQLDKSSYLHQGEACSYEFSLDKERRLAYLKTLRVRWNQAFLCSPEIDLAEFTCHNDVCHAISKVRFSNSDYDIKFRILKDGTGLLVEQTNTTVSKSDPDYKDKYYYKTLFNRNPKSKKLKRWYDIFR